MTDPVEFLEDTDVKLISTIKQILKINKIDQLYYNRKDGIICWNQNGRSNALALGKESLSYKFGRERPMAMLYNQAKKRV